MSNDSVELTKSEVSKRYWNSPEGRRQKKLNAETTRKTMKEYYRKRGGTHSKETKEKISRRTLEGIARAEASGERKSRRRPDPKDRLWKLRVAQVRHEFNFIGVEAADSKARELLKEDAIKFYSKYRGVTNEIQNKVERSLRRFTEDEITIEIILDGITPDFNLPQLLIDRIVESALASGNRYPEEIFFRTSRLETDLWLQERTDFEKVISE